MTSVPGPIWPARVIVVGLDAPGMIRGKLEEYLHSGLTIVRVPSAAGALVAIGRDSAVAAVLVPTWLPDMPLSDFIEVVHTLAGVPVIVTQDPRIEQPVVADASTFGAEDFVALPVTAPKLERILVAIRHRSTPAPRVFRCGELELDADRFRVLWHGRLVRLTPRLFDLLAYLIAAQPRVVTVEELVSEVAPHTPNWGVGGVRKAIGRIRVEMEEAAPGIPVPLETLPGFGYRLTDGRAATVGTDNSETSRSTRKKTSSLTRRTTSLGLPAGSVSGQSI